MRYLTVFSGVVFALLVYLLAAQFGSEFMLVSESWTVVAIVCALVLFNALMASLPADAHLARFRLTKLSTSAPFLVLRIVWGLVASAALVVLAYALVLLLADYFTGSKVWMLAVIAAPFLGFVVVLMADAVHCGSTLSPRSSSRRRAPISVHLHTILVLTAVVVAVRIAAFSPDWNTYVSHEPVFERGAHRDRAFRIPALLVLPDDSVIAFAESRTNAFLDWGDIDLVARRSDDGGATWGAMEILADAGDQTAGNPCVVYDRETATVFLSYTIDNKTLMLLASTDGGQSWSEPRDLAEEFALGAEWTGARFDYQYGSGPGIGIQVTNGRLVIPAYYFDERGAHVVYSDDHGKTWTQGDTLGAGGESQVVELPDGRLMINARNNDGGGRIVAFSVDGGMTWGESEEDEELPDIGVMASVISWPLGDSTGSTLLFSSPTGSSRGRIVAKMSEDSGETWLDHVTPYEGPAAYSSLGTLSDGTVLMLVEAGRVDYRESIQLVRIPAGVFGR